MANPAEVLLYGVDESLKTMETLVSVGVTMSTAGTDSTLLMDYEKTAPTAGDPNAKETTRFRAALLGPVSLDIQALLAFISQTGLKVDDKHLEGLKKPHVLAGCKAFFYDSGAQTSGAEGDPKAASVAMLLTVETDDGSDIIGSFIDAEDVRKRLGKLFQLKCVSLRILRCDSEGLKAIRRYVEDTKGKSPSAPVALKAAAAA